MKNAADVGRMLLLMVLWLSADVFKWPVRLLMAWHILHQENLSTVIWQHAIAWSLRIWSWKLEVCTW